MQSYRSHDIEGIYENNSFNEWHQNILEFRQRSCSVFFFNFFIKGSLNYHPLKWMFRTVTINQQINELHIIRFMIIDKVETCLSKDVLAWAYDFLIRMKR